jgi:hypothetical protein
MKDLQVISVKDYADAFKISISTAKRWFKQDLQDLGRRRITQYQFAALYEGLQPIVNVKVSK